MNIENSTGTFKVGDRVTVKPDNPAGNPRTPKYIRGKSGVVVEVHGVISNLNDHRGLYPPLYTVAFDVKDVFGGMSPDKLRVDLHEDWLERL
jgi:nitrile hydratase subunit beta